MFIERIDVSIDSASRFRFQFQYPIVSWTTLTTFLHAATLDCFKMYQFSLLWSIPSTEQNDQG